MPADDHPRIEDLRRRVDADPASIAFAQLAEEYRRLGDFEQAVACCRHGLLRHPNYLSARVTLGRALTALHRYDEAARELDAVLAVAPDHRAAADARAALPVGTARSGRAEALFDFDALLEALGQPQATPPPVMELLLSRFGATPGGDARGTQGTAPPPASRPAHDAFAALERTLAEHPAALPEVAAVDGDEMLVLTELNAWLEVLARERQDRAG